MVTQAKRTVYTTGDGKVFINEREACEYEARMQIHELCSKTFQSHQEIEDFILGNSEFIFRALAHIHAPRFGSAA